MGKIGQGTIEEDKINTEELLYIIYVELGQGGRKKER